MATNDGFCDDDRDTRVLVEDLTVLGSSGDDSSMSSSSGHCHDDDESMDAGTPCEVGSFFREEIWKWTLDVLVFVLSTIISILIMLLKSLFFVTRSLYAHPYHIGSENKIYFFILITSFTLKPPSASPK